MLLERLHTAFLCWGELGLQHFERQSADTAANMPMPIIHVEVNNVAREMMVPWVAFAGIPEGDRRALKSAIAEWEGRTKRPRRRRTK
jgi:hypothetical protein